jgi:hypothetical protein
MTKTTRVFIFFIPLVLLIVLILPTRLNYPPVIDEIEYHIPAFKVFEDNFPNIMLVDYARVVTGPLPYIIATLLHRIIAVPYICFRLISILFWLFALFLINYTVGHIQLRNPIALGVWLVSPYIFVSSLYFDAMGIAVFSLAAVSCGVLLFDQRKHLGVFLIIVGLVLLSWSRQSELYFILPVAFYFLASPNKSDRKYLIALVVPVLTFLPLFLLWGGIRPPMSNAFDGNVWPFNPCQITLTLSIIGFALLPIGFRIFTLKPLYLFLGLIGLLLGFLLPNAAITSQGIVARFELLFYSVHPILYNVVVSIMAAWGIYCLIVLWQTDRLGRFFLICILVGSIMLLNIDRQYEKYQYSLLLPLFILTARSVNVSDKMTKILFFYTILLSLMLFLRTTYFELFYNWIFNAFGWSSSIVHQ